MDIRRGLRLVTRAALAFHRWFMKYSGTTMIIDNIEERRRRRKTDERSDDNSGNADRPDAHPEE